MQISDVDGEIEGTYSKTWINPNGSCASPCDNISLSLPIWWTNDGRLYGLYQKFKSRIPDPSLMQITHNYKLDEEKIEFEFTKIENI